MRLMILLFLPTPPTRVSRAKWDPDTIMSRTTQDTGTLIFQGLLLTTTHPADSQLTTRIGLDLQT